MSDYAYHGTSKEALRRIRKEGLVPQVVSEGPWVDDSATMLFFAPYPDLAGQWGEVVLRFPWPNYDGPVRGEVWEDTELYTTMRDGVVTPVGFLTDAVVPPESIEVLSGKQWLPLVKNKTNPRLDAPIGLIAATSIATLVFGIWGWAARRRR